MRALLLSSIVLLATSCQRPAAAAPSSTPSAAARPRSAQPISGRDARALVASGALLLDVRTVEEFQELRVEGARNVPLHELGRSLASLPKDKPIVVYCAVGSRSASAAGLLASAGFDVRNLGAMANWNQ